MNQARKVYICSNPQCTAVYDYDPQGHCSWCRRADGGGWSTMVREVKSRPPLTNAQVKHMVDRFLGWSLPKSFAPDAGITFTRTQHQIAGDYMPVGTNLLDASQAEAMVRHMIEGLPE